MSNSDMIQVEIQNSALTFNDYTASGRNSPPLDT